MDPVLFKNTYTRRRLKRHTPKGQQSGYLNHREFLFSFRCSFEIFLISLNEHAVYFGKRGLVIDEKVAVRKPALDALLSSGGVPLRALPFCRPRRVRRILKTHYFALKLHLSILNPNISYNGFGNLNFFPPSYDPYGHPHSLFQNFTLHHNQKLVCMT